MRKAMRTPYTSRKEMGKDLPPFDSSRSDYTAFELQLYTDQMLREDRLNNPTGPQVIFQEHIEPDWRREVLADIGTVDEAVTKAQSKDGHTLYNRRHPQGRKVNSKEQRSTNGASYFR